MVVVKSTVEADALVCKVTSYYETENLFSFFAAFCLRHAIICFVRIHDSDFVRWTTYFFRGKTCANKIISIFTSIIFEMKMMHLNRCVWHFWFLALLNTSGLRIGALSPGLAIGKKATFGSSSPPLLRLSSKNDADDDDAPGESDVEDANDFIGKASGISQPSKTDLYSDDELAGLLEMHKQLQSAMMPPPQEPADPQTPQKIESPDDLFAGGLHDFILQTIDEIDEQAIKKEDTPQDQSWFSESAREKISELDIIAVASDVDGTIVGFDQTIHPNTIGSIKAAQKSSKLKCIFPATGKTRWGARNSLGPELSSFTEGPGVYCQVRRDTSLI